jgi:hypothetical protein
MNVPGRWAAPEALNTLSARSPQDRRATLWTGLTHPEGGQIDVIYARTSTNMSGVFRTLLAASGIRYGRPRTCVALGVVSLRRIARRSGDGRRGARECTIGKFIDTPRDVHAMGFFPRFRHELPTTWYYSVEAVEREAPVMIGSRG